MGRPIIYAGNSATQAIAQTGTVVQFPNIVRKLGCGLNVSGGNVTINSTGFYEGMVSLNIDGSADGTATAQVYANGSAVPYATVSITTSSTSMSSVTIPFVVRNTCGCVPMTISVNVGGVACNVTCASIVLEKE